MLSRPSSEVARIMARKYGEQSSKKEENTNTLADELADVLFVLTCIANQTGIDLEQAMQKNLSKKTQRDKNRHINNPKLNSWSLRFNPILPKCLCLLKYEIFYSFLTNFWIKQAL